MLFVKESLRFILFSFFKRCRIITQILSNIKKNFQHDSKESIFADMLSSNLRWVFLTIRTCIEKVEQKVHNRNMQNPREESLLGVVVHIPEHWPIMQDLRPFLNIIHSIIDSLDQLTHVRTLQKNSKYYESTLQKLIDKLFQ